LLKADINATSSIEVCVTEKTLKGVAMTAAFRLSILKYASFAIAGLSTPTDRLDLFGWSGGYRER
jgi:hypothetical protein